MDKLLSSCVDVEVNELVDRRSKAISSMWRNLSIRDNMLFQKSRPKWIQDGGLNSQYFYNLIKGMAMKRFIGAINTVSGLMDSVEEVKDTVWNFFNQKFREPDHARPVIEHISTRTLIHVSVHYLEAPFSDEEIKETVWCCDRAKSMGSGGYSFVFIKNCWKIMKDDVLNFVKGFHNKVVLSKAITSFFPL